MFLTYRKRTFTLQPVTLVYSVISNCHENSVYLASHTHSTIYEKCIVITSFVCEWLLDSPMLPLEEVATEQQQQQKIQSLEEQMPNIQY